MMGITVVLPECPVATLRGVLHSNRWSILEQNRPEANRAFGHIHMLQTFEWHVDTVSEEALQI